MKGKKRGKREEKERKKRGKGVIIIGQYVSKCTTGYGTSSSVRLLSVISFGCFCSLFFF